MAIDWTIPMLVGIWQSQMLQERRFTNIEAQRKQLPPMPRYVETHWLYCDFQIDHRQGLCRNFGGLNVPIYTRLSRITVIG
jgi:hypothetical protein